MWGGAAVQYVLLPLPLAVSIWAAVVSLLLNPVHVLAKKLVYKKLSEGRGRGH